MKIRTFRAPDEEWDAAKERAAKEGISITEVLREALRKFAAGE